MKKRRAFTLTELVVTMSAGSTLMVMAIGMIHQTMLLTKTSRQRADNDRSANRLVDQFRHDVYRAEQIFVESPDAIRIESAGDGKVTYQVDDQRVVRQQTSAAGNRYETYPFDTNTDVGFALQSDPALASLTVKRESGLQGVEPRIDRQVAVVVGRLRMYESSEVTTNE